LTVYISDISPHAQKAIVGRFLGFEALAPNISWIESRGYRDAADRLRRRLCWLTNEVLDDPDYRETLEYFLEGLVRGLQFELATFNDGASAAAGIVVNELGVVVANYNAAPYDPLEKLAAAVAETAAGYYREFRAHVPDYLWQSTYSRFSFVGGKIGISFARTIHVQLWTEFGTDDQPSAQVFVSVSPRWLDQDTIAALPRSLLHEYIAHVPQGPFSRRRMHPDPSDMFAEGWMDYIAHCIFRAVLKRHGPSLELWDILSSTWALLYEEAAERFFIARCSLDDGDRTAAARREGAMAARQLHELLRRLPETADNADEFLYRLSFTLNVSQLDNLSRARFAAKVRLCSQRLSRADALVVPLRDWVAGRSKSEDFFKIIIGD
jgi:hypothetical protein